MAAYYPPPAQQRPAPVRLVQGTKVQITQAFKDSAFAVKAWEQGTVSQVMANGNVEVSFGGIRKVTFLPHETPTWLRVLQVQAPAPQPVYVAPAQPAYVPPAQPAYIAPPAAQNPAYVAPPAQNPAYHPPAQPAPAVDAAAIAKAAIEEYKKQEDAEKQKNLIYIPIDGNLNIRVRGAKKLPGVDTGGGCDPFVELKFGKTTKKTDKKSTKNPEWGESFDFYINKKDFVFVKVFDWNRLGSNELMFTIKLPIHGLMQYGLTQKLEFALSEKARLSLDIDYVPKDQTKYKGGKYLLHKYDKKPFGLTVQPGPNNVGGKVMGFASQDHQKKGIELGMYVTSVNGICTVGTPYKVVMQMLKNSAFPATLEFADLRTNLGADE